MITDAYADTIRDFLAGRQSERVEVVGVHGQTVLHRPQDRLTVQLIDADALARRCGLPVVHDLRGADVAAGGQGAPMVPVFHQALVDAAGLELPVVVVNVGGVRTNFRMPDVYSFGLGGGSLVRQQNGQLSIGPDSVGYELASKALVFGGDILTTTDIIVASGGANIGDTSAVKSLERHLVDDAIAKIHEMTELAVDRMKTSAEPIPVIVVGGGSILINRTLNGVSEMITPPHFAVANAIGAAIAQVGGETDRVFSLEKVSRDDALAEAREEATQKAITAGADPATIQIVDVEEVPLAYLPSSATRIRVKAVGDLTL